MKMIDVFVQGHRGPEVAVVSGDLSETLSSVLGKLPGSDVQDDDRLCFLEDLPTELDLDSFLEELVRLDIGDADVPPLRLHVSSCRRVQVTVRFNGADAPRRFPPSATIERVRRWAAQRAFGLSPRDAAEHVLQLQGSNVRPDRDAHIGTLTDGTKCAVDLDLVPCKRVEG